MRLRATLFLATSSLFAFAAPSLATEPAKSAVPVPASKPAPRRPTPKAAAPAAPALPPPDVALDLEPAAKGNLWTLRVKNKGSVPVRVVTDPRLVKITFPPAESPAAGKPKKAPKPIVCALPDDARPWGDGEARVLLPGKTYAQKFDVRMLCFADSAAAALETATHFSASYGFPVPRGALVPPFVVGPLDGLEPSIANAKEISLGDHELSHPGAPQPASVQPAPGPPKNDPGKPSDELPAPRLTLTQTPRVDAGAAEYAQITVNLKNESSRAITLAFRPQTVSFEVTSPSGRRTTCGTAGMTGIGRELLTTLGKDRQSALTLAIGRICPEGTFEERGLYAVSAKVDTRRTSVSGGESLSLYSGAVTADKPTWLRVRTGRAPAVAELRPTFD